MTPRTLGVSCRNKNVKNVAHLPVSKHAAIITSYAILHHGHASNFEHVLLYSTKEEASQNLCK
jgi:hypothetical protein